MKTTPDNREQLRSIARDGFLPPMTTKTVLGVLDDLDAALADAARERERAEKAEAHERELRPIADDYLKVSAEAVALRTALAESQRTLEAMQRESQRVVETNRAAATMKGAALTAIERIVTGNAQLLAHGHTQAELDELVQGVSTLRTALAESRAEKEQLLDAMLTPADYEHARATLYKQAVDADAARKAAEARAERYEAAIKTTLRKFPTWALDDLRGAVAETTQKTWEAEREVDEDGVRVYPQEPGTSSPDDAERAAREWWAEHVNGVSADFDEHPETSQALVRLIRTRDAQAREAGRVEAVAEVVKYVRAVADAREGESMPRAVFKTLHGAADAIEHKFKRPDRAKGG